MLPNHAPLMVAERFKVLEALFPGRIDLGLGRAPGTDPVTSYALRRRQDMADDFPERLQELLAFDAAGLSGRPPVPHHPRHAGRRGAAADLSARLERFQRRAGRLDRRRLFLRAPFRQPRRGRRHAALPAHLSGRRPPMPNRTPSWPCMRSRRTATRRRKRSPPPSTSISCAARAANICRSRVPKRRSPIAYAPEDRAKIRLNRRRLFVGSAAKVRERLAPLIEATQADEVMITTMLYDHAARKRSYELLAHAFGLRVS